MVDFPGSPVDGQQHVENGQVWTYREPPGAWSVGGGTGLVTELMDGIGGGQAWCVVGDWLFQWGSEGAVTAGPRTVNMPQAYKDTSYRVICTPTDTGTPANTVAYVGWVNQRISSTQFSISPRTINASGPNANNSLNMMWLAMGEAPDSLKKPKEVLGGAGNTTSVKIVDEGSGYQIVGGKLIQWGNDVSPLAGGAHVFPIAFKQGGDVTVTAASLTTGTVRSIQITSFTETQFQTWGFNASGANEATGFTWIAIGDVPDGMQLPTEINVIGEGVIQEFHDPNGEYSWRIMGRTLECWGEETVSQIGDGAITTFPKTFARPPTVVATPKAKPGGQAVRTLTIQEASTTQFEHWTTDSNGNTGDPLDRVTWHAIGEWDGVS